jgi:hypothetical protein
MASTVNNNASTNNTSTNNNTSRNGIAASRTFWLAVGILAAFFIFYGYALLTGINPSPPHGFAGVERVASTLGPIAAAVIGYYFGQRPVQSLTEQVSSISSTRDQAREGLVESLNLVNNYEQEISRLRERLRVKQEIIDNLKGGSE